MTDRTKPSASPTPLVSQARTQGWRRRLSLLSGALFAAGAAAGTAGCLQRPVVEQEPVTSNVFVTQVPFSKIDAIDLLFVVDNSVSMADKQTLLVRAVPQMVERLVTPDCVNADNGERQPSTRNGDGDLECAGDGFALEFEPVNDINIGVISSSLGGFGSPACTEATKTDKSLLMPKVRPDASLPDPTGLGFLNWAGGSDADVQALSDDFALHVAAAGETGCGFEAPLEAWYRFLVDPSPPASLMKDASNNTVSTGPDAGILQQRADFLRPTSLVAIVVLTDENDCSAMEGGPYYRNAGFGWLIPDTGRGFASASEACATNPNDACCYSCLQGSAPEGCTDTCERTSSGSGVALPIEEDRANARCFQNRRRFGVDLLYPTTRYVDGLSKATIVDSQTGQQAPNPLLLGAALNPADRVARMPNLVFFAGILGVPWQDIATPETLDDPDRLEYMTANTLSGEDRWSVILGDPGLPADARECAVDDPPVACGRAPIPPTDPFMVESMEPRSGANPITGENIVPLGGSGWSEINGHEYDNSVNASDNLPANDDLQYSCIFPLAPLGDEAVKRDCTADNAACDCGAEPTVPKGSPLCKPEGSTAGTAATTTQYWGKAYPATRVLQVLRDFGENSIVGSICPKIMDATNTTYFGYNPAVNAIVDRLAEKLTGTCLPRELSLEAEGVPCAVVETIQGDLDCSRAGRTVVDPKIQPAVVSLLEDTGFCTTDTSQAGSSVPCTDWGMCTIQQAPPGPAQQQCFGNTAADTQDPGYCYIDPAKGPAAGGFPPATGGGCVEDEPDSWGSCTNENVAKCPATQRRILRFVGRDTPINNSTLFVACVGEATSDSSGVLPPLPAPSAP